MVMNNLDGTTKTEMSFGTKNKTVHATIKFDDDSFKVLNKDGSLASLHAAQGTDSDSAVTLGYFESEITRLERQANKITSSNDDNMIHYNEDSGTLGVNNVTADRITGLTPNKVLITDEDGIITASGVGKTQLRKLNNLPDDTQTELDGKADKDHTHKIADVEGLQDELDSKALVEHTHKATDIDGFDGVTVHSAEYADEAEKAKMDINGTPIANYVRNVTVDNNKITITKGNGDVTVSEYIKEVVPATEDSDGEAGLVPAPCRADEGKFLSALGTWEKPKAELADTGITVPAEEINSWPKKIDDLEVATKELIGEVYPIKDSVEAVQKSVEDLNTELDAKADAEHTHEVSDINGLRDSLDSMTAQIQENGSDLERVVAEMDTKAPMEHTHEIADVIDLQTTLDGKAAVDHTHEIADITDLADALADKAEASHTHEMDEVNGLTDALDTKAEVEHTHDIEDVTGLQDALDEKAMADHDHTISQISDIADASVAEAVKAKQDINGKALTDYVTGITADGANLKVSKGDGTFTNVTLSTEGSYSEFEGATESEAGTFGLVPAPQAGDQNKVLSGAGTWVDAPTPDLGDAGITASAEELNYMTGVTANVQTQLNEKAAAVHTHTASDISDFAESAKTALATELEAKADVEHVHEMDDVTGLMDALGGKAASEHTHTMEDITDLDLSAAEVAKAAEATKATTDKNDKDITEYVADVTQEDSKIKVTKGDGSSTEITINIPEPETYENFTGASDAAAGEAGLVPAPAMGDQEKFLKADGTWATPVDTNTEYDIATAETAGLVKPSSEIAVTAETGEMTVVGIAQSKVTGLENKFATMSQASNKFEITDGLFEDTRVSYRDEEIRVMYSTLTPWAPQDEAEDPNTVTMALRAYAPADATGYRIAPKDEITEGEVTAFGDPDSLGRNYVETRLPVATFDAGDSAWTYLGSSSTAGKYVGWYVTVEWYNAGNKIIGSETVRVNLATESTFNSNIPGYMGDYAKSSDVTTALEGKADTEHTHVVADITDLDLSNASVAEATKATQDANGKAITDYVADVTLQESTITVSKGNGDSSEIHLPEGTAYSNFTGTDGSEAGAAGLVPAPQTTDANKYLKSDGTWATIETGATVEIATEETAGIVKASSEIAVAGDGVMSITAVDQAKVTGLDTALAAKADVEHVHEMDDVTGLMDALGGKAASEHTHEAADITDLQGLLDAKANVTHTHVTSDVTGLDTALAGKAASVHTHAIADVTDLETTLAGKVDTEDLAEATVKAATQDTNGKPITEYVAGVTLEGNTLKIAKGDSSTSDVELPAGTVYEDFTGASAEGAGEAGLVPAPAQGDQDKFLKADGTWGTPVDTNTTYDVATSETAGLVKPSSEIAVDGEGVMTVVGIAQEKVTGLTAALSGKADAAHTHTLEDIPEITLDAEQINGLPAAVAAKAEVDHTHDIADITDLNTAKVAEATKVTNAMTVTFNGDSTPENTTTFDGSAAATLDITLAKVGAAAATHTHEMESVNGLSDALSGKANTTHSHAISDVTDLQTTLDGKAASEHTHEIDDVTGLQDALDTKLESDDLPGIATGEATGIVKGSSEISVGEDGALTVASIAQDKVSGLTEALASKVDSDSLTDATVGNATKATQDKNGKDITTYVADVTHEDSKITITKGDGSFSEIDLPEGSVYSNFTGTTGTGDGKAGLVPAPVSADVGKFLKSDGTWATVTVDDASVEIATSDKAGIVKPGAEFTVAPEDGAMSIASIEQSKVTGLTDALSGKADASHTHEIANVNGLQDALDAKLTAATLPIATTDNTGVVKASAEISVGVDGTMTVGSIAQSKVADLETALAGKAATEHTHEAAEITDLNSAVVAEAGKTTNALSVTFNGGTQAENNVTFDGSSAQTLDITLAKIGAAAAEHTHETADVTGLDTALAGKADSVHTHEMTSVTGLSEALEAKADSEHTHTVSQITDIASATVAAAGKATNDKNDKDITTYVADVTFAENKITVKKGDNSSSEIELPEGTVYSDFTGASAEGAGGAGLVPAPAQGDQDKFLKADGTWTVVEAGSDVAVATEETAGIVKASSEIAVAGDGAMSITAVSQDKVTGLTDALSGKAATVHTHAISDVTDLQTTLDNKLEASDLAVATDSTPGLVKASTEVTVAVDGALGIGTIEQAKVNGLTAALGAKADTEHTHTVSDITDLDLSEASVAEAAKATTDKNEKDITTYVADVTKSEDNKKIVITKGDSSSTEIELPEAATYSAFTGASAEDAGSAGLVPGPVAGDQDKFLKADGTWAVPVDTNTTYAPATTEVAGIVRASTEITVDGEGIMTVGSLAQSKVEGLTDALSGKANATHSHTASDISDLADATVKAATQDTSGNALTSYVKSLSVSGSKLTVTKGDETSDELDLPSGGTGVDDPFTGTDGDTPGTAGLVPAPAAADADKFLASDGTWKVVQGAGGEVTIKYTSQVPTTAAVGGIEEGYIPPSSGIDILDLIYNLLHPYVAPELTATMLPRNGGTVGIATTQNITGVRVSLNKTGGNKIMSYQVYDVDSDFDSHVPLGELYSEDYENGFTTGAQTVSLNSPYQMTQASAHKYLTVRVMDLDGRETVVKTASFNFVETYYWGTAPGETVIDETFVNGDDDKTTQASAKGTKVVSVNPTNEFVYFCAPKSYGEIATVKDQNQFDNTSEFTKNKTEVTINGRDYYVYHNDPFSGEMTFTFFY